MNAMKKSRLFGLLSLVSFVFYAALMSALFWDLIIARELSLFFGFVGMGLFVIFSLPLVKKVFARE